MFLFSTCRAVAERGRQSATRKAASPKPPTPKPGAAALEDLLSGRFFKPARALEPPGKTLAAGRARAGDTPGLRYDSAAMVALSDE